MQAEEQTSPVPGADAFQRLPYLPPTVEINALRLITLGGSVGGGDSGASGSEEPGGGIWGNDEDNRDNRHSGDADEWVG